MKNLKGKLTAAADPGEEERIKKQKLKKNKGKKVIILLNDADSKQTGEHVIGRSIIHTR
jgi:hypothetical protein